jgi:hypothetical protein
MSDSYARCVHTLGAALLKWEHEFRRDVRIKFRARADEILDVAPQERVPLIVMRLRNVVNRHKRRAGSLVVTRL